MRSWKSNLKNHPGTKVKKDRIWFSIDGARPELLVKELVRVSFPYDLAAVQARNAELQAKRDAKQLAKAERRAKQGK